jgi:hypothetical protein
MCFAMPTPPSSQPEASVETVSAPVVAAERPHRLHARVPGLWKGELMTPSRAPVPCTILNASPHGALVRVGRRVAQGQEAKLSFLRVCCAGYIVWSDRRLIGIRFVGPASEIEAALAARRKPA